MKAFVFLVFICTTISSSFGQENFISWNDKQPLQWIDFNGPVKDSSNYDAESFAEVRYTYTFNSLTDFTFDVFATFNKNASWYKKEAQSHSLLKHEQLHFDIAELFAKKLKEQFLSFNYTSNFREEIAQIFEKSKKQYHFLQEKYDEETSHSLQVDKQRQWEFAIKSELKRMQQPDGKNTSGEMIVKNE